MKYFKSIIFIYFLFNSSTIFAQFLKGNALEASLLAGRILPHSDETSFRVNENSIGVQVNWQWQTYGQKEWHELRNYPLFGLSALYFDLGEKEIFGNAFGIVPNLTIPFLRRNQWNGAFVVGSGVAWLSEHYDVINNPQNNAIGSRLNNATLLKWTINYQASDQVALQLGGGLMHFSNGGAQLPNFGINIPVFALGIRYFPVPLSKTDFVQHHTSKTRLQSWAYTFAFGTAYREAFTIGGPRYAVYNSSFALSYYSNRHNKISIGLEHEYHQADYAFGLHTYTFLTEKEARKAANRLAISVANEFLFGHWAVHLLSGFYVGDFSLSKPYPFYLKLSQRYYFSPFGKKAPRIFAGVSLKTHLFRAEYISLNLGVEF